MPTKSEVIYQRALHFRQLVSEISIKHYVDDPKVYPSIVDAIFDDVFRDEIEEDTWNGEDNRRGDDERRKEDNKC
jgi:hypothetical protein